MKRWLVFLFLFCFVFVSAFVDVGNYSVRGEYVSSDSIQGFVNLTIEGEDYSEEIVFSDGGGILLGDFLEDNGVVFGCSPSDCSSSYEASSGASSKTIRLPSLSEKYLGFVLVGDDVVLDSVDFEIDSDFGQDARQPLTIEFFESEEWEFSEFSDVFLSKDWGCFDSTRKRVGALIGKSYYCEMIGIENSGSLKIGADVGNGGGNLNMVVYPESGVGASWECSFNPNTEDGCVVDSDVGEFFYEGNYQVCVGADDLTTYNIYYENAGKNCGFAYDDVGAENSLKDYAIFAQGVKYADAEAMEDFEFGEEYVDLANEIISERYNGDCSEGCVLPLKVFGIPQNFSVYNVSLIYTDSSEWKSSKSVYELEKVPAKVNFEGKLDLNFLNLSVSKTGEYYAELSGEYLFKKKIVVLPAPIIDSVFPLSPPAGVPVPFYASIDFDGNDSLRYKWNFGDGNKSETSVPYVVHVYRDLKNYTLSLEVGADGNLSSKKIFNIETVSPESAVKVGLKSRKESLAEVKSMIAEFPSWYSGDLLEILEIAKFESDLARLEREQNNSFDVEDFRDVAIELYALNIPVVVWADSFESPFLMTERGDINIEPVASVSDSVSGAENNDYVNPILTWQNENVNATTKWKNVFVSYLNGEDLGVLSVYSYEITAGGDRESYFIINKPFGELYFSGASGAKKSVDSTSIVLSPGVKKSVEFYYKDIERVGVFVSPRLSTLVIEENIDTDCNFNGVCEKELKENSDGCRSDCKPIGKAITFLVLGILFFLVVYTGLQIWYKKHYESYLFKDSAQLYNLLMYVTNARARGLNDLRIRAELKTRGWSSERVDYVIKKSLGKTVGMVEIIPIERVSAWIRNRRARKQVVKESVASVPRQGNGNINKSGVRI